MDKQTKDALEGSILKWKRIVRSTKAEDDGTANCPLCELFYNPYLIDERCKGCPVNNSEHNVCHKECSGTPYDKWVDHLYHKHGGQLNRQPYCKECLRLAKEELKFLESLREE